MKDIKITVVEQKRPCPRVKVGDWFVIQGDKVHAPYEQGVCFYSLSAMMPALAAWEIDKERSDHYIHRLTRFTCPMNISVYEAVQCDPQSLEDHASLR